MFSPPSRPLWALKLVSKESQSSGDEPDEELTARSCCGPLLYFSIQIDGQRESWRSHIFLEKKGLSTAPYFPYSPFPFIDFLIDFYSIQPVCNKYIQVRRGAWQEDNFQTIKFFFIKYYI